MVIRGGVRFHMSEVPLYPPRDIPPPPYPPLQIHAPPVPQRPGFVFRGGPIYSEGGLSIPRRAYLFYSEAGLSPGLYDAERSMVHRERHRP